MGTPPYLVLLRVGFAEPRCHHRGWCALTAPFHPYQMRYTAVARSVCQPGGLFSVALSLGSPPLDVIQHPALRSPDFPPPAWVARSDHLVFFIPTKIGVMQRLAHSPRAIENGGTAVDLTFNLLRPVLPWIDLNLEGKNNEHETQTM